MPAAIAQSANLTKKSADLISLPAKVKLNPARAAKLSSQANFKTKPAAHTAKPGSDAQRFGLNVRSGQRLLICTDFKPQESS